MKQVLVIGYGNPLRGDDGVGPALAEILEQGNCSAPVKILACHQLMPEHVIPISEADAVLFIDADVQALPGEVRWIPLDTDQSQNLEGMIHAVSPEWLLVQASALYGNSPQGYLITIGGECFDYGLTLSGSVQALLPALAKELDEWIKMQIV